MVKLGRSREAWDNDADTEVSVDAAPRVSVLLTELDIPTRQVFMACMTKGCLFGEIRVQIRRGGIQ